MKTVTSVSLINPETRLPFARFALKDGWSGTTGEWTLSHPNFHPAELDPLRGFATILEDAGYHVILTETDESPSVPGRVY